MLENSGNVGVNQSRLERLVGSSLTDDEFARVTAGIKDKKNTSDDAQNIQNNNTVTNSSTDSTNLQVPFSTPNSKVSTSPNATDMEAELLGSLLLGKAYEHGVIDNVASILKPDDFSSKEHKIIFRTMISLFKRGVIPNIVSLIEELRSQKDYRGFTFLDLVGLNNVLSLGDNAFTTAYSLEWAKTIKKYSLMRQLSAFGKNLSQNADNVTSDFHALLHQSEQFFRDIQSNSEPAQLIDQFHYFDKLFNPEVDSHKQYAERLTGFGNIDDNQIFSPGLYVIGATPACGKTTFCWQLLHQLADLGETCIFCSYEMSRLELYSKTLARELFKRDPATTLTAADIRRGATSSSFRDVFEKVHNPNFPKVNLFELRDENVDELLRLLKPYCAGKTKAPVICLDYLQIVPPTDDKRLTTDKAKIDDIVHKLKTFQRETNTTFIVISSFNRMNYYSQVSFESFKDSGNIEYSADVVWALQLNVVNSIKIGAGISDTRKKFDDAKRQQPRIIQLKCLKNRQGNNYDCYFHYFSAHDFFKPYDKDVTSEDDNQSDNTQNDSNQTFK